MEQSLEKALAGIIVLAIFFLSVVASFLQYLLSLYRFFNTKVHEYQVLDRGDFLTLLIDAGMSHDQALWFYDTFYAKATCWERCLIKLLIKKHCF